MTIKMKHRHIIYRTIAALVVLIVSYAIWTIFSIYLFKSDNCDVFSYYPANSILMEKNWTHVLQINDKNERWFWEKHNIRKITVSVKDMDNNILFEQKNRIKSKYTVTGQITWTEFKYIDIYVYILVPYWVRTTDDTLHVANMTLEYDNDSRRFRVFKENWNKDITIE